MFLAAGKAREPNKLFTHFDFLRVPRTFSMRGPLECFSGLTRSFFGFIAFAGSLGMNGHSVLVIVLKMKVILM